MSGARTLGFWAVLIAGFAGAGLVTLYLGLIVTSPLIGHATWSEDVGSWRSGCSCVGTSKT
jgi:hypothetical protein